MSELARPSVMPDVIEEHFEELDILWEQRESVLFAPDWNLQELLEHEERCDAHLDGLTLAQGHAVDLARPALAGGERGAATAATMVFLALGTPELDAELLTALAEAADDARDGIRLGLRHSEITRIQSRLLRLASEGDPFVRAAALDVLAFHRAAPPPTLGQFVEGAEPDLLRRLYPALGRFGGPWSAADLDRALGEQETCAQRDALETSARVGLIGLSATCRHAATRVEQPSTAALEFLGVVGRREEDALPSFRAALANPALARAALAGLGARGAVDAVPLLIDAMRDDALSAEAGAAFRRITGAVDVEASEPSPPPGGLSEEELDFWEPVRPSDPDKASRWWGEAKDRFSEEGFWQDGKDLSEDGLGECFDTLPLGSRRGVYLKCRAEDRAATRDFELECRAIRQIAARRG